MPERDVIRKEAYPAARVQAASRPPQFPTCLSRPMHLPCAVMLEEVPMVPRKS
jgi:hypothetical protein